MTIEDSQLGRLLTDFPDLVVVVDPAGGVIWANALAERLFGRSLHDSVGQSGFDFVHPDDLEFAALSLVSIQEKEIGIAH